MNSVENNYLPTVTNPEISTAFDGVEDMLLKQDSWAH